MSKRRPRVVPPAERPETDGVPDGPIRVFWDYDGPLWTTDGPLPADADWLQTTLGLSHSLAAEIEEWAQHLEDWPDDKLPPASVVRQGDRIRRRLEDELAGRYEVRWEF